MRELTMKVNYLESKNSGLNQPTILQSSIDDWPAVNKWCPEFIQSIGSDIHVRAVVGNKEQGNHKIYGTTLSEVVNKAGVYLKEFDLFKNVPSLKSDVNFSNFRKPGQLLHSYAWIGNENTETGLHYDLMNNFLFHIYGKKTFYLLDKKFVKEIPKRKNYDMYSRNGDIDLRLLSNHPLNEYVIRADLEPGDVLYVPKGWWHQVENNSFTISVSGFVSSFINIAPLYMQETLLQWSQRLLVRP